jgi:hypothetical protein
MTDPLSKHWNQPPLEEIAVDDECAMMTKETFDRLPEYSMSIPSGVYAGKMWKHIAHPDMWLRWYQPLGNPKAMHVITRKIIIVTDL